MVGIDGGPRRLRRSGIGEGVVPWRGIEEKRAFAEVLRCKLLYANVGLWPCEVWHGRSIRLNNCAFEPRGGLGSAEARAIAAAAVLLAIESSLPDAQASFQKR